MEATDAAISLACGLLIWVATICIAYAVQRIWPSNHYPRVFSVLAAIATVAGLYLLYLPGTGLALGVLVAGLVLSILGLEEVVEWLKGPATQKNKASALTPSSSSLSLLLPVSLGAVCGIAVSLVAISVFLVPPAYLQRWVINPDPLSERIERALSPAAQLSTSEVDASKQLTGTVSASSKAGQEPAATTNTIHGIKIKAQNSSRQADGAIYIGVNYIATSSDHWCGTRVSSDKSTDGQYKLLHTGEAVTIQSSRGRFRIVLTALEKDSCTFDVVKD